MLSTDSRPFSLATHSPWLTHELRRRVHFMWIPKAIFAVCSLVALLSLFASAPKELVGFSTPHGSWAVMVPWLYAATTVAGLGSGVELRRACLVLFLVAVACLATAALLPGDTSWISHPGTVVRWLPSVGVASAVFCGLLLRQQIRLMRAPIAWHTANIVSCFAAVLFGPIVQQHALANIGAGLLLGLVGWAVYLCALPHGHLVRQRVRRKPARVG